MQKLEEELARLDKHFNITSKKKERLDEQQELLDKYTGTLVSSSKGAGPGQLVGRDTIGMIAIGRAYSGADRLLES